MATEGGWGRSGGRGGSCRSLNPLMMVVRGWSCWELTDFMVLEVAVAGQCEIIVTYNKRDFSEAAQHGLQLMTPKEFLQAIGDLP